MGKRILATCINSRRWIWKCGYSLYYSFFLRENSLYVIIKSKKGKLNYIVLQVKCEDRFDCISARL